MRLPGEQRPITHPVRAPRLGQGERPGQPAVVLVVITRQRLLRAAPLLPLLPLLPLAPSLLPFLLPSSLPFLLPLRLPLRLPVVPLWRVLPPQAGAGCDGGRWGDGG
ncbi:hypothetical protein HEK616_05160 [Streptomyces nigrescens]|uniref:Uncharacterized protein n=1 Tax=Streptomyces nigrescens TaxID=1920 RepID=A0ABN6QLE3_STRNI|nr:hypothetical protein HEK616_05160 [Streptomyces nigrescens]